MNQVVNYKRFLERFRPYFSEHIDAPQVRVVADGENATVSRLIDATNTPFATNPIVVVNGLKYIVYNPVIIEKLEFNQSEVEACLLHEFGHLINRVDTGVALEIQCDKLAVEANMALPMLSALFKMQDKLGVDQHERINALVNHLHLYRPEWTCGRYNQEKQVAIMYNLIAGYSYFFEGNSANVIGEVLEVDRNNDINVESIASVTGISMESLWPFFIVLSNNGLLTEKLPTESDTMSYRKSVREMRMAAESWADKTTREKLPMDVSNTEQAYFSAVDDGKSICSCMFELTYRCSEMCIHCYNPGATRNNNEVSHRGDCKELALDDYKRIIDDMYDHGLVKVCLSGGDPFSKEFVWELLDYLYQKGIAVDVFTNGQRITDDVQRLADYYPRLVGVSIYSGVAEDHDAITRIPGSWEKSMEVVKQLHELAVPMNLKCCIMQPNLHSYYMVADIANAYGAVPQFEINISESNEGDICAKQLRLTEEQLQIVLRDDNLALYVGKEAPNYGGQKRDLTQCSCGAGGTGFCMSPNGDLRACTAFTQTYGNLQTQSIEDILTTSPTLKEWRSAVVGDYIECGKHDYCDYCNLCAGLNYTEHGDFKKPAETNCYMAKCRYNLAHRLMEHGEPMSRDELIKALRSLPKHQVELRRQYQKKG